MDVKKKYPLELLKIIEPICKEGLKYIKPDKTSQNYKLLDRDPNSNYYFVIFQDFEVSGGKYLASIEFKPCSGDSPKYLKKRITYKEIGMELSSWIGLVKQASNLKSIYDDEIASGYQKEFFETLQIDQNDQSPVNFKDLPKLEEYITLLQKEADNLDDSEPEKEEIKLLCSDLSRNMSREGKADIFKKITSIWALFTKTRGYDFTTKIIKKLLDLSLPVLVEKGINSIIP